MSKTIECPFCGHMNSDAGVFSLDDMDFHFDRMICMSCEKTFSK